ncbi:MAG: oxidase [Verrucomicrobiales bacterium]|nr:oxidase [Verrucomicrobiales bacterium]
MPNSSDSSAQSRRAFLRNAAIAAAGLTAAPLLAQSVKLPFANGDRELVRYPQKRPLIRLTTRPPQLETPFSVFNEGAITPNDAFFVRYHLAGVPTSINSDTYRVEIKGSVNSPLSLSLHDLRKFEAKEVVAVLQCSGNSRGFVTPRVGGGQLGNGAMGNAHWKGVPLKAILAKAGIKAGAKQVTFDGLDKPVVEKTPDFVKALDVDQANDGEVMLAYEMNGQELPVLNGFPLRLIVPGYFGTYWVKHVNDITVIDEVLNNFWMNPAYRIPDNDCACVEPGTTPKTTVPIKRYNVRSFITSLQDGAEVKAGRAIELKGIAFDGGSGIREVVVSSNNGKWTPTKLGKDLGKYSFREWHARWTPSKPGDYILKVCATNNANQMQPETASWNPSGYMRSVIETVKIKAV